MNPRMSLRFACLLAGFVRLSAASALAQTPSNMALSPSALQLEPGQTVAIQGVITPGTNADGSETTASGVQGVLVYDPTVFELVGSGRTLPSNNPFPVKIKDASASFTISGTTYAAIVYDYATFSPTPLSGPTTFVTYNLEVLPTLTPAATLSSEVYFTNALLTSAQILSATGITNGVTAGALQSKVSVTDTPNPGTSFTNGIVGFSIAPAPSSAALFALGVLPLGTRMARRPRTRAAKTL